LAALLAGCKNSTQNSDAVRQGVVEYLQKAGLNVAGMDIALAGVKFNGNRADARVDLSVKGTGKVAMSRTYFLEQKDNKWVVVGKEDADQHGAMAPGAAAGGENPHAGGAIPSAPSGGGKMPSPEDLPPAGKKK
jgi:hypothetical protein